MEASATVKLCGALDRQRTDRILGWRPFTGAPRRGHGVTTPVSATAGPPPRLLLPLCRNGPRLGSRARDRVMASRQLSWRLAEDIVMCAPQNETGSAEIHGKELWSAGV